MGFFDLKAICAVCDNEVGLNRFKIKKSDAWICPSCLKKAGGSMKNNLSKVTLEELQELVLASEYKSYANEERIYSEPLQVAKGMYQYCIENNYGRGWNEEWGIKHFQVIEDSLISEEIVVMTFIGFHNFQSMTKHDHHFAYALTNKRLIMAQKNALAGHKLRTVPIDDILDISFESGTLNGIMIIDTVRENFHIGFDKYSAENIYRKVLEVIDEIPFLDEMTFQEDSTNISIADELKKFKELLDMGAITQDEFDAQKNKLLK